MHLYCMYVYFTFAEKVVFKCYSFFLCMYVVGGVAINDTDLKKAISSCYQCIAECVVRLRTAIDGIGDL